jgi:hypothetical protein
VHVFACGLQPTHKALFADAQKIQALQAVTKCEKERTDTLLPCTQRQRSDQAHTMGLLLQFPKFKPARLQQQRSPQQELAALHPVSPVTKTAGQMSEGQHINAQQGHQLRRACPWLF